MHTFWHLMFQVYLILSYPSHLSPIQVLTFPPSDLSTPTIYMPSLFCLDSDTPHLVWMPSLPC